MSKSLNDYAREFANAFRRSQNLKHGQSMGPASRGVRSNYKLIFYEPDPMNWGVGDQQIDMELQLNKKEATLLADNIKRLVDEP